MTLPVRLHSGMTGSPDLMPGNGQIIDLLTACLVNGFNTQSVSSATASGGVVTFNFAADPGFSALDTVTIAGASNVLVNNQFRVQSAASNQVLVAVPGISDGAVGGTITMKFSPLGWTRPYTGTNLAVYRQGGSSTTKRYLRIYDGDATVNQTFKARGYEAMTAVSAGTGPFPTTAQVVGNGVDFYTLGSGSTPRPWLIVGTPRFFTLIAAVGDDYASLGDAVFQKGLSHSSMYFGELANIGKPGDTYAHVLQNGYGVNWGYIARSHTGAEGAVDYNLFGIGGSNSFSCGSVYPDPASGGVQLLGNPIVLEEDAAGYRGQLPGVLCTVQAPVSNGPAVAGDIISGVSGVTGRVLLISTSYIGSLSDAAVLLDEDWGDV